MDQGFIFDLGRTALVQALTLVGPVLVVSLSVGLAVSVFQAVTQINEPTLTFVPKLIGVFAVLILLGPLLAANFINFTATIFSQMGEVVR